MKKQLLLSLAFFVAGSLMAAPVTVLSNKIVAKGYYPRLNKAATELTYLSSASESYAAESQADVYVTNEDLKLVLYKNGTRTELYPHGTDVNYIWSSISPDGTKILFNTRKGTAVCDLNGKELYYLGHNTFPTWYGNDYVIATTEENDGHDYTAGAVLILSLDGQLRQVLTDKSEIAMDPAVSYETGQIVYNDFDGNIHLMQINLSGKPIEKRALPAMRCVEGVQPKTIRRIQNATKADFKDFKIYINPGHGGYDGNDRGMKVQKDEQTVGYYWWESQSNLDKGLRLNELLTGLGFQTKMSRTENTSGPSDLEDGYYPNATGAELEALKAGGDRLLSAIVAEANTYNADFMLSIHSNAGGPSNYTLQLFRGLTPGDAHTYSDMPTAENNQKAYDITTLMGNLQMSNKVATWSRTAPVIAGDKTFAREVMGWSNGYGVLRKLKVPGTISEGAMHDYFPETHRLMNMDYKWQEAWFFMKTFCSYYLDYKQDKGVISGQVRDAYRKQTFPEIKRIKGSRDELMPVNKAVVELLQNGEVIKTYTTDTCYNGVFFFWDLEPGEYTVRVPEGQYELRVPTIPAAQSFYYTKEETVTVKADEISHVDMMVDAQRSTPPEVISYTPAVTAETITDSVEVSVSIVIDFNWDMKEAETEAAFSISPAVDGKLTWENSNRRLRFTPTDKFEKGTEYTVTIAKSACHPDAKWSNTMVEDFSFKFRTKTRDHISLLLSYPVEGQKDVPVNPSFILAFDGKLNTTSAKKSFSIVDMKGNVQAINGRSYAVNRRMDGAVSFETTNALQPNTAYKLIIKETLEDVVELLYRKNTEITFMTGQTSEGEGVVMDNMEEAAFKYNVDETLGAKGTTLAYTSKKLFERASNQLNYEFIESDGFITYTYLKPSLITANSKDKLGMYVFGDLSENELVAIWNAEGDIKYTSFGLIDFAGWQYLNADMSELAPGVTYQFMGLRLKCGTGLLSSVAASYILIDNIMLTDSNVSTDLDGVTLESAGVHKVVENDQVIIIKDGVRYNVLGTVVE